MSSALLATPLFFHAHYSSVLKAVCLFLHLFQWRTLSLSFYSKPILSHSFMSTHSHTESLMWRLLISPSLTLFPILLVGSNASRFDSFNSQMCVCVCMHGEGVSIGCAYVSVCMMVCAHRKLKSCFSRSVVFTLR